MNEKKNKLDIINNLKLRLLLLEIKKKFNINISKQEIEEYIKSLHDDKINIVNKKTFFENIEKEMYMDKILKIMENKIDIVNEKISLNRLIELGEQK